MVMKFFRDVLLDDDKIVVNPVRRFRSFGGTFHRRRDTHLEKLVSLKPISS